MMTPGLSSLGKIRGHFIISEEPQPIDTKPWSMSRKPCLFGSFQEKVAPIQTHEQARDEAYLNTWKFRHPLQLLGEPVTVVCQGPRARCLPLENVFSNWHLGFGRASEIHQAGRRSHVSQGVPMKRLIFQGRLLHRRKWTGKGRRC